MVRHIVMWKLVNEFEGMKKEELALEVQKRLMSLEGKISELKSIEVGINGIFPDVNSDVILSTTFNSFEDLAVYAAHPEHLKVGGFIKSVASERRCVDYEY